MKKKNLIKGLILLAVILNLTTSFGQSVVINEIVTDPQQDWSTNDFNGILGTGSINQGTDEFIELYIKTAGLNLTNWTIELLDGTNVIGALTSTGAFDDSNYITSGDGTFTNTEIGDFLVLGDVDGTGKMNNSITINLKDSGGVIIDTVTLGAGAGEAPSGNAGTIGDESVQRIPNGTDTDIDDSDFSKGITSLGTLNPTQVSWDGSSSTNWSNALNWATGSVPISSDNVYISSGLINYPTVTSVVTVNYLTIASGATLKATNTFTANVTYNRTLTNGSQWYYMSSPVAVETYNDDWATANSVTSGQNNNKGLSWYDNTSYDTDTGAGDTETGYWRYLQSDDSNTGLFNVGQGYGVITSSSTTVTFIGTGINTSSQTSPITTDVSNFNLVGNPFTSFLNLGDFYVDNPKTTVLAETEAYFWNGSSYDTKTSGLHSTYEIAPGQGFFIEAAVDTNLTFDISDTNHLADTAEGADTFQKSSRPEIHLFLSDGATSRYSNFYYIDGTTTGFDSGYDGKLFGGVTQSFALYSHLVSSSEGKYFQLQSLPKDNYENMVIPIGINADAGKEITFSTETLNLPTGLKVYLEDRETNTFNRLDGANKYTITLTETSNGIGRFYLHTAQNTLNLNTNLILEKISIYKTDHTTLRIVGLSQGKTTIKLFNMLGKQLLNSCFTKIGVQDISLPQLSTGIYLIQLESEKGTLNKKIILD
ncbi:T9SS type A sorting domain-containing protein [uncultured Polaribacter sp.]|uniref:T9SS type A sorting domain-containing protein n=1 Tax=uncultured Polaribacter sp. TaxID=174711 RepID=UPI003704D15E